MFVARLVSIAILYMCTRSLHTTRPSTSVRYARDEWLARRISMNICSGSMNAERTWYAKSAARHSRGTAD